MQLAGYSPTVTIPVVQRETTGLSSLLHTRLGVDRCFRRGRRASGKWFSTHHAPRAYFTLLASLYSSSFCSVAFISVTPIQTTCVCLPHHVSSRDRFPCHASRDRVSTPHDNLNLLISYVLTCPVITFIMPVNTGKWHIRRFCSELSVARAIISDCVLSHIWYYQHHKHTLEN